MSFFTKCKVNKCEDTELLKRASEELADAIKNHDRELKIVKQDNERNIVELKSLQDIAIKEIKANHVLDLAQRDFDLKNNKDKEINAANKERDVSLANEAVLKKEVEMLRNMVEVNAAIIDVKDLVNKLVAALPKIDLKSISVIGTPSK